MDVLFAKLSTAGKGVICIQLHLGKTGWEHPVDKMGSIFKCREIWGPGKKLVIFLRKQANKGKTAMSILYCLLNNIF